MNGDLGEKPGAENHLAPTQSEVTPPPVTPPQEPPLHTDGELPTGSASQLPPKPRVWTVSVALSAIFAAQIGVGIVIAIVLISSDFMAGEGENAIANLMERMMHPGVLAATIILSELAFLAVTLGAARFSPQRTFIRLGLGRSALGWPTWPLLILGTLGAGTLGMILLEVTFGSLGDSLTGLYQTLAEMELWQLALMALVMSVFPGVCEEMFFRGYMQRRFLERWHPAVAIGITSVLFAAIHLDPYQVVAVFPTGVFLGIVAWRTGSIWPGVVCHTAMNFISVMGASLMTEEQVEVNPIWPLAWYAVLLVGTIVSVILLVKVRDSDANEV